MSLSHNINQNNILRAKNTKVVNLSVPVIELVLIALVVAMFGKQSDEVPCNDLWSK